MNTLASTRFTVSTAAVLLAVLISPPSYNAQVARSSFHEIAPQGFGDRQNSWAWSMEWFQGKLYVGTSRAYLCVIGAIQYRIIGSGYPPSDPDVQCPAASTDLPLQAEIWTYTPQTQAWARVYRSPLNIPIPQSTKFTAPDIGFRGMKVFQESDGTQALYVASCAAGQIWPGVPEARLLRSIDGVTFTPVPNAPGTFLGNLNNQCFRGLESFNGKLYALAGDYQGGGVVVESATPSVGNNSFRQISPAGQKIYEVATFNNNLYLTQENQSGFTLLRTPATGSLPYTFTSIFSLGGYKAPNGNPYGISMKVFNGSLYVGGDSVRLISTVFCGLQFQCVSSILQNGGAELFRVHTDDTWDLIAGQSRQTPVGYKTALSGLGPGFGFVLNQHLWRMEVFDNRLFVGTYDISTELRNAPSGLGTSLVPELGFDLWSTADGVHFTAIDITGFEDRFNYGARSLLATPAGLFLGTANPFYGLRIYQAVGGTGN